MDQQRHHTHDSRQQEIVDAIIRVDTAYGAAMASAHVATGAATEAAQAALAGMASAADAVEALGRVRATQKRTHWLATHMRLLKAHLHLSSGGFPPLPVDDVLFDMLRGDRAVPDFAPGADDTSYKAAFLAMAREHLADRMRQLVRDFDVEWRANAPARAAARRRTMMTTRRSSSSARRLLAAAAADDDDVDDDADDDGDAAAADAPPAPLLGKRSRRGR
jgi:hypothetical protein